FGQLMAALAELKGEQVVGMDLVETCPLADESGRTSVAAAKIVRDALLLFLPQT
ncbi:MAG: arginase family protein, partial [Clostridia bacterium]|nr:arginase family protein [Clostridia bacterium]